MAKRVLLAALIVVLISIVVLQLSEINKLNKMCQEVGWESHRRVKDVDYCVSTWPDGTTEHEYFEYAVKMAIESRRNAE